MAAYDEDQQKAQLLSAIHEQLWSYVFTAFEDHCVGTEDLEWQYISLRQVLCDLVSNTLGLKNGDEEFKYLLPASLELATSIPEGIEDSEVLQSLQERRRLSKSRIWAYCATMNVDPRLSEEDVAALVTGLLPGKTQSLRTAAHHTPPAPKKRTRRGNLAEWTEQKLRQKYQQVSTELDHRPDQSEMAAELSVHVSTLQRHLERIGIKWPLG